jgi:uncharacterized protein (TIGR02421 family)
MSTPLHIADRALTEVSRTTHLVGFVTPTNLAEEERAFFSSQNYEPQFKYKLFTRTKALQERLEALKITENTALAQVFKSAKEFLLNEISVLQKLGTTQFTNVQMYGTPSKTLINKAYQILQNIPRQPQKTKPYSATQLRTAFEKELSAYGFSGWAIQIKPAVARVAVSPSKRVIIIRDTAKFSAKDIKSLLVHEIGVHVLRAMNGYRQHYELFGTDALPGYLPTEEGLAIIHEQKADALSNNRLRRFAGRVITTHLALDNGFREVFNELTKYFTPRDAFILTTRAKRGLADTSEPGGFIKDHVYLEGKYALEDFMAHGGKLTPLYAGKIGLEHIGLVEQEIIQPPVWLPRL